LAAGAASAVVANSARDSSAGHSVGISSGYSFILYSLHGRDQNNFESNFRPILFWLVILEIIKF
jgi:hypothetical protein